MPIYFLQRMFWFLVKVKISILIRFNQLINLISGLLFYWLHSKEQNTIDKH